MVRFIIYVPYWMDTAGILSTSEIRESMKEGEIEIIIERAKEQYPNTRSRVISDNGPQFIAKRFQGIYQG